MQPGPAQDRSGPGRNCWHAHCAATTHPPTHQPPTHPPANHHAALQDGLEIRRVDRASEQAQLMVLLEEGTTATSVSAFDRPDVPASVKVGGRVGGWVGGGAVWGGEGGLLAGLPGCLAV